MLTRLQTDCRVEALGLQGPADTDWPTGKGRGTKWASVINEQKLQGLKTVYFDYKLGALRVDPQSVIFTGSYL